jgi:uncharacterized protein (DUF427 family)
MTNPAPGFRQKPDHRILLDTGPDPVTVLLNGEMVAATTSAVILQEDGYPARAYLPRKDVQAELVPTSKTTHCPFKGDTVYYDVMVRGEPVRNGAWSYEEPYDEMSPIAGHVCFDDVFDVRIG